MNAAHGAWVFALATGLSVSSGGAEQFGLFTYREVAGSVEITGFPKDLEIHVDIPAEIDGMPVTAITGEGDPKEDPNDAAFAFSQIKSVTIPDSVTTIGEFAFGVCLNLTSVRIPDSVTTIGDSAFYQSNGLVSVDLGEGVTSIGSLAFFKCFRLANLSFPESLTAIGDRAFEGSALTSISFGRNLASIEFGAFFRCDELRTVVFPEALSFMGSYCFDQCAALSAAIFLGSAPAMIESSNVFNRASPGFTVYFLDGNTGFNTPTWTPIPGASRSYPSHSLATALTGAEIWLLGHGLPMNTDLDLDSNGDGVNHLMAYALDLDPDAEFIRDPIEPVLGSDSLSITFFAGREDVIYTAQASSDLETWSTDGVTLSEVDIQGRRTASVNNREARRLLRLHLELGEP